MKTTTKFITLIVCMTIALPANAVIFDPKTGKKIILRNRGRLGGVDPVLIENAATPGKNGFSPAAIWLEKNRPTRLTEGKNLKARNAIARKYVEEIFFAPDRDSLPIPETNQIGIQIESAQLGRGIVFKRGKFHEFTHELFKSKLERWLNGDISDVPHLNKKYLFPEGLIQSGGKEARLLKGKVKTGLRDQVKQADFQSHPFSGQLNRTVNRMIDSGVGFLPVDYLYQMTVKPLWNFGQTRITSSLLKRTVSQVRRFWTGIGDWWRRTGDEGKISIGGKQGTPSEVLVLKKVYATKKLLELRKTYSDFQEGRIGLNEALYQVEQMTGNRLNLELKGGENIYERRTYPGGQEAAGKAGQGVRDIETGGRGLSARITGSREQSLLAGRQSLLAGRQSLLAGRQSLLKGEASRFIRREVQAVERSVVELGQESARLQGKTHGIRGGTQSIGIRSGGIGETIRASSSKGIEAVEVRWVNPAAMKKFKGKQADGKSLVRKDGTPKTWEEVRAEGHPMAEILAYYDSGYQTVANRTGQIIGVIESKPKSAMDFYALDLKAKPADLNYIKVDALSGRIIENGKIKLDPKSGIAYTSDSDLAMIISRVPDKSRVISKRYKRTAFSEEPTLDTGNEIFRKELGFKDAPFQHGAEMHMERGFPVDKRVRLYVPGEKTAIIVKDKAGMKAFGEAAQLRGWPVNKQTIGKGWGLDNLQ